MMFSKGEGKGRRQMYALRFLAWLFLGEPVFSSQGKQVERGSF
jgi:hypothetical protein